MRGIDIPGEYPYTRGIHFTGYRGKLWTMRQFAGFGTIAVWPIPLNSVNPAGGARRSLVNFVESRTDSVPRLSRKCPEEDGRMKGLTVDDPVFELRPSRRVAHDQILEYIAARFSGHAFARLVGAVLQAEGFITQVAGPGPDGGVDILAAKGPLGFDGPHICVQVKSSKGREDVTTLRALQGTMKTFNATQGLLVCWGGFTKAVHREARQSFFQIRLWSASEVVDSIYQNYDRLPEKIQAELPLERVWMLVSDDSE